MYPEYNQEYVPVYIMDFPEIREYVPPIDTTPATHPFYIVPDTEGEGVILSGPALTLLSHEAAIILANDLYTLAMRL